MILGRSPWPCGTALKPAVNVRIDGGELCSLIPSPVLDRAYQLRTDPSTLKRTLHAECVDECPGLGELPQELELALSMGARMRA